MAWSLFSICDRKKSFVVSERLAEKECAAARAHVAVIQSKRIAVVGNARVDLMSTVCQPPGQCDSMRNWSFHPGG